MKYTLISCFIALFGVANSVLQTGLQLKVDDFFESPSHTNNWAILVFWFNYRHVANVLSLYQSIKRLGIPDSNIIMMLAEDVPCNPRNPKPGTVFNAPGGTNLYNSDVEVDYRGNEVTVENFIRVLTGRHHASTPRSKRLLSDHQSNVLIYLTGHGGDGFLKFQDSKELTNSDLGLAIQSMYEDNRYNEIFLIVDTCRSESMYEYVNAPGVLSSSSSLSHEESYSYDVDHDIGVHVLDRYTYFTLNFMSKFVTGLNSSASMQAYLESCPKHLCLSTMGVRYDTYPKDPTRVRVTDFFGSARIVQYIEDDVVLDDDWLKISPKL